jgi:glycosyltransferase involved in cell wall biosynthesis
MKLSVIIIAHNEAAMITDCLKSVKFADEIIISDKRSIDKTVKIAQKFGAKIDYFQGDDFDVWRNQALKKATNEWVLYLDPDERISQSLKNEILQVIKQDKFAAYKMPRQNHWWGKQFKHCGGFLKKINSKVGSELFMSRLKLKAKSGLCKIQLFITLIEI